MALLLQEDTEVFLPVGPSQRTMSSLPFVPHLGNLRAWTLFGRWYRTHFGTELAKNPSYDGNGIGLG
jgi:hypothetical protein